MAVVSILIPVRNTARWLRETVASAQAQTFSDWQLFAIDDGSTDNSPDVLAALAREDPRVKFVARENRGLVETRNELLAMADSPFIAWLDSDDRMTPNRLALQLARFDSEKDLLCLGGGCTLTDPDGLPIKTHSFPTRHEDLVVAMREEIAFYFPSVTMRTDAARKIGGFRQPLAISEDYDICLRLSEIGRVGNVPDVVLLYRQHMASTANAGRAKTHLYSRLVRELAEERRTTGSDRLMRGEKVVLDFAGLPTAKQTEVETYRRWGWWALQSRNLKTARKYAAKAWRKEPFSKESWRLLVCAARGH
jgi:glycosyltransferase involved in cell wall biosynthesis